jgi:osmotically-inducible protein OsmY
MTLYHPTFSHRSAKPSKRIPSPFIRSDSAIEEEIWDRFLKEHNSAFHTENLEVDSADGQVLLTGHMAEDRIRQKAGALAAQVRGVIQVQNEILLDSELQAGVIRRLAEDERTTAYLILVKCHSGWINLGGIVPTQEAAQATEEVVALTPGVRGILNLPWVGGLPWKDPDALGAIRRPFQPKIGAAVYDSSNGRRQGNAGRVTQVIIDPCSLLISHVAVRVKTMENPQASDGKKLAEERVIPVSAIEAANRGNVWLEEGKYIGAFPEFYPDRYPLAPEDWQPPFPFQPGTVRWSW